MQEVSFERFCNSLTQTGLLEKYLIWSYFTLSYYNTENGIKQLSSLFCVSLLISQNQRDNRPKF